MNGHDDDRIVREALAAALESVGKDTGAAIEALRRRAAVNRRLIKWLTAVSVMLVVTVAGLTAAIVVTLTNASDIRSVQERTSDKVLCPLYGAFLAAENNPVPDEIKKDPAQLEERQRAFDVIRQGADELGCNKP